MLHIVSLQRESCQSYTGRICLYVGLTLENGTRAESTSCDTREERSEEKIVARADDILKYNVLRVTFIINNTAGRTTL